MPWSFSPGHHGIELILDEAGDEVGQIERDPDYDEWVVSACPVRFPSTADLPAVFAEQVEIRFSRRGDLLRFFGIPLPGVSQIQAPAVRRAA